jgi:uncharacterized OB-fold protein
MHADFPLPDIAWEPTREYWAGAARGQLLITRCDTCARYVWYPEPPCRYCGGARFGWTEVCGRGALFSWSVIRHAWIPQFAAQLPFISALVALQEDPAVRLVTCIVGCDPEDLRCDMPVAVVFGPLRFPGVQREVMAPLFSPVGAAK